MSDISSRSSLNERRVEMGFSVGLLTPIQGLSLLAAVALFLSFLSPEEVRGWSALLPFVRHSFFPKVLVVLLGIAGLQLGNLERRWIVPHATARARTIRLLFLTLFITSTFMPFLILSAAEDGVTGAHAAVTAFYLWALTLTFAGAGYAVAGIARTEGTNIILRYGIFLLALLGLHIFLPWCSPMITVSYLWNKGRLGIGFWTVVGLDLFIVGWWCWRFSTVHYERFGFTEG